MAHSLGRCSTERCFNSVFYITWVLGERVLHTVCSKCGVEQRYNVDVMLAELGSQPTLPDLKELDEPKGDV